MLLFGIVQHKPGMVCRIICYGAVIVGGRKNEPELILQFTGSFVYAFYYCFHNDPVLSLLLLNCFYGLWPLRTVGYGF